MEIYDIVMILVLVAAMLFGALKGFAWQLASIASIVASYFVALKFREPFSRQIDIAEPWNRFLAMLILYIASALLIWVAFRIVSRSIDRMRLKEFDRHIGAVFGLIKGGLYCVLVTLFAVTLAGQPVREKVVSSRSGRFIADVLVRSESVIPPEIHEVVSPYLERFEERFRSQENVQTRLDPSGLAGTRGVESASSFVAQSVPWSPENRPATGFPSEPSQRGPAPLNSDVQQASRPPLNWRR